MARTIVGEAVVKLRLIDELSRGVGRATSALKSLQVAANALGSGPKLTGLSGALQGIARDAAGLKVNLAGLQLPSSVATEIRRLASSGRGLSRLTADVAGLSGALRGLGAGITGSLGLDRIRQEVAALRAEIRRFNAMPTGGMGSGPRQPMFRPGLPGVPGGHTAARAIGYQGAGPTINRAGRTGIDAAFNLQRQNTLDFQAGLDSGESREIRRQAIAQSRRRLQIDVGTLHEVYREAMIGLGGRAGGGMGKLQELAPDVADGITQMMTRYGPERAVEQFRAFFRAADVLDRNDRASTMRELLEGFTRAQGVEGAEFNYRDLYNAARYAKSAGQSLSNRFLYSELPVIMGDVGGSRAGTELGSLYAQLIGDRASNKAKEQQRLFGIRDDNGVIGREMMTDPGEWARKILMPGLQRNGVDINDPRQVVEAVNKVVSNQIVAAMIARAITQRDRIRERQQQYDLAPAGERGADTVEQMDGRMALSALIAQFKNLLGAGFDPILEEFRGPMRNLATTLNEWAEQVRQSPEKVREAFSNLAGTIGGIAITLGGLKLASIVATAAAGPALLRSAGALTAAAAALKASAGPGGLPVPRGPAGAGGAATTAGAAAAGGAATRGFMRFVPGLGWAAVGAAAGYVAGQAIGEIGAIAQGKYWTPRNEEEVEGYKARIVELQEQIAGIDRRTHPSMRGQPNAERANIESQLADLQNRVAAAERGFGTGGSFGQTRPEDRGHETGAAFSANVAQGVAAGAPNVLEQMNALMQQLRAKAAEGVQINIRATTVPGTAPMGTDAPGRSLGGPVSAGQLYEVGENGPELFSPGANGSIIPNHVLGDRGGRSVRVGVNVGGITIHGGNADEIMDRLADRIRSAMNGAFADLEL